MPKSCQIFKNIYEILKLGRIYQELALIFLKNFQKFRVQRHMAKSCPNFQKHP